jgi:anti-sigma regulatory factor (Ser/Thr protein kinase)
MDTKKLILEQLNIKDNLKVADIMELTGFSRAYINRFFQELRNEGKVVLIGKANRAHYVIAEKNKVLNAKKNILTIHKILKNINLSEDTILDVIKRECGIFVDLKKNIENILNYAFTEMLNNAIDHSQSVKIEIVMKRNSNDIRFDIIDHGIGVFNNIMKKKNLKNELEAIQDLLKGKQTTAPQAHSGEGIFFTSKAADSFVIESSSKKLIFNNSIDDIFIQDIKGFSGTKVIFTISTKADKELGNIFKEYSGESFEFDKTNVAVRLYKMGSLYISRSQARRIMNGLEKFKTITLDFNHIKTTGQAFADEIFRVWKNHNPGIEILTLNTNENVNFMIKRALAQEESGQQNLFKV